MTDQSDRVFIGSVIIGLVLVLLLIIQVLHGFDNRIRALEAHQSSQEAR